MPASSTYWKQQLKAEIVELNKVMGSFNARAENLHLSEFLTLWFPVEYRIGVCAGLCRKLIELNLCAQNLSNRSIDVKRFNNTKREDFPVINFEYADIYETRPEKVTGSWILENFDRTNPENQRVSAYKYFSRIAHSSYIVPIQTTFGFVRELAICSPKDQKHEIWIDLMTDIFKNCCMYLEEFGEQ